MKTKATLFLSLILLSGILSAQPFSLFSEGTSKEYAPLDETWERSYSLQIDSVMEVDDLVAYFLHTVRNENDYAEFTPVDGDPEECYGWGGCTKNSGSTGFGTEVHSPAPHVYQFVNVYDDTLRFDLSADSSVFFENTTELYALIFESESELTVFGLTDQVQSYRIGHYDTEGNAITSPLHDFTIRIGQNIGLIDFFLIDGFPQVEEPLALIGDSNLDQSLTVLTSEMIYDFEEGDVIQYRTTNYQSSPFNPTGPSVEVKYLKTIFLSRSEEADSLRYTILNQSFVQNGESMQEWTEEVAYYRYDTLSALPFYRTRNSSEIYSQSYSENLLSRDFCDGEVRLGYEGVSGPYHYCEMYDTWCMFDTNGPPEITRFEYVSGLGRYYYNESVLGGEQWNSHSKTKKVIYYSKGDVSCGQEAILAARTADQPVVKLTVYPNPSQGVIQLRMSSDKLVRPSTVQIFDMSGRRVASYPWKGENAAYDVSELASGLYLLQVIGAEGVIGLERLVVQ